MVVIRSSLRLSVIRQQVIAHGPQRQIQRRPLTSRAASSLCPESVRSRVSIKSNRSRDHMKTELRYRSDTTTPRAAQSEEPIASKIYTFSDISKIVASPSPGRILIDTREPSELDSTGRIPEAKNLPINSSPDGLFLPAEDFEEKFGWEKPKSDDELVFYCKAGVRSRAAAGIAKMAGWTRVSEYPGSWLDWVENGGKVER